MAMRGRGGRGNPSRLIVGRVYEQFKPMSEWRQEDDYDTLLVYLPGFQKEYIKVTTEDVNMVRVRGERLVTENKWSRFQEDFRVPENCEMRGIRARFDGGILTITMPRKTINEPPSPSKTEEQPSTTPKTDEQPFRRTNQEALIPKPKEEPKENKPNKSPQSSPLKDKTLPPQPIKPIKQEPLKTIPEPKPKETNEDFKFGSLPTMVHKKDKHDVVEKPNVVKENDVNKTDLDKGKEPLVEENMKTMKDFEGRMGKSNDGGHGGFRGGKLVENKVVARRRWMINEDRKLLVNVGVGVLVIVALGVHVSYIIGLIGKEK